MAILSFTAAASRIRHLVSAKRQYQPLMQAKFGSGDLYSQANCLFEAGYREAAVITGCTAIRRDLRQILLKIPEYERGNLPEKTPSRRQYATCELTYFFFHRGIVDHNLKNRLNQFQEKVARVMYGVKLSKAKGKTMMADLNAFRPKLEQAMGRALQTLPVHKRTKTPKVEEVSAKEVVELTRKTTKSIAGWYRRAFGISDFVVVAPLHALESLRSRFLISNKALRLGRKLFNSPETLGPVQVRKLKNLVIEAQQQTLAERRKLVDPERFAIGVMVEKGHTLEEINDRFGLFAIPATETKARDARQVEDWVTRGSLNGGGPCRS